MKIAFRKSNLFAILDDLTLNEHRALTGSFGCKVLDNGLVYLGVPICMGKPKAALLAGLIEKLEHTLTNWKANLLSFPARLALINSVLHAIPSFIFRCLILPDGTLTKIDDIARSFLWGGKDKVRWIDWNLVCSPKSTGGMGLRRAKTINLALFAKQAAKLLNIQNNENKTAWETIVSVKYHTHRKDSRKKDSYSWKCLQKTMHGDFIRPLWSIGDGKSVSILWDRWVLDEPIGNHPWASNLSTLDNKNVDSLLTNEGLWQWENINQLLPMLQKNDLSRVPRTMRDSRTSPFIVDGKYSVSKACDHNSQQGVQFHQITAIPGRYMPSKRIWWFVWKLVRDKLQTRENLAKRNIIGNDDCPMCGNNKETIEHWLVSCPRSIQFWDDLRTKARWNLDTSNIHSITSILVKTGKLNIWNATNQALTASGAWYLWKLRNDAVFNTSEDSSVRLTTVNDATRSTVTSLLSCFALPPFVSLQHDQRFDDWLRDNHIVATVPSPLYP